MREIPEIVELHFTNQYPKASNIDFKDYVVKVQVHFELEGETMMATYTNKGIWKGSEKTWDFEKLSEDVKDGFEKAKYAGDNWEVDETVVLHLPGNVEQYRLRVKKSDLQKKYLFFNANGRLIRTSVTL
ncbi:MAG: hypothetical protein HC867_04775 [Bacteroidia bacterium]|nr:hypothetical protein [Bacteroidia bacterium]